MEASDEERSFIKQKENRHSRLCHGYTSARLLIVSLSKQTLVPSCAGELGLSHPLVFSSEG